MNDRFVAGAIAGFISALIQAIFGYFSKIIGFTDRAFHDYGQAFILSSPQGGPFADFVGLIAHVSNGIVFGIVFAYLLSNTSSRFYIIKGGVYGMALWHVFFGMGTLYRLPTFHQTPPISAFSILIGSVIYGIVLAYTLRVIEAKTSLI